MHFSSAIVLAIAGIAAAQSSTSVAAPATSSASTSGCGSAIDQIIAACLTSQEPLLKKCAVQDWKCLCEASQQVLTCYNNCPSDPNAFGVQQESNSYCNAAKSLPQTSSSAAGTTGRHQVATPVPSASSSTAQTTNAVHTGFAKGSASGSASASATGQGAANGLAPAGGLLAAVLGLALL